MNTLTLAPPLSPFEEAFRSQRQLRSLTPASPTLPSPPQWPVSFEVRIALCPTVPSPKV